MSKLTRRALVGCTLQFLRERYSHSVPPSLLALALSAQKGLNGHKPPAGQSQLK